MDAFLATLAKGIKKQGRWLFPPLGITASFAFTNLECRSSLPQKHHGLSSSAGRGVRFLGALRVVPLREKNFLEQG